MGFIKDFKNFAVKGNVVDMAVGVVIGGAFGKIVTSLVNDIIMPLIGILAGKIDFKELVWTVGESPIAYGMFLQNVLDFIIIALSIFTVITMIENLKKRYKKPVEPEPEKEPEKPSYEVLLEDIKASLEKIAANSENK